MKKLIFFSLLAFIYCCSSDSADNCTAPVNPNGDSELALLMRRMASHAESEKKRLNENKMQGEYVADFEKITTARPTDSKNLSPAFEGYALLYIKALKEYHKADKSTVATAYNNLIQSCINCHQDECPGPIKRIEKMKLISLL